ncbi:methionine gamma-lyase family protein [Parvimonas micra]
MDNYLDTDFRFESKIIEFVNKCSEEIEKDFENLKIVEEYNQLKVLNAFKKQKLSATDFSWTTGYGYGDFGREKLERIYCDIFKANDAIVRQEITCGTHAISLALQGTLYPGDEFIYITGTPYDTLLKVIGLSGNEKGTLSDYGIKYDKVDLINNKINIEKVLEKINSKTKLLAIQRSPGYSSRQCISISELETAIKRIKEKYPNLIIMVDNCYCEFVETKEPIEVGANIVVGSLLKNLGAGITLNGGYIVSNSTDLIESISNRLTSPGLGKHVGVSFGTTRAIVQGLYFAPHVVNEAVKSAKLFSYAFEKLGYETIPKYNDNRSDIIQVITLKDENKVIDFCRSIQEYCCVDSHVTPYPWDMPGYSDKIIMASGSFIDGSSIELSADGPLREPFNVYYQGGLNYYQAKIALINVLNTFNRKKYISI